MVVSVLWRAALVQALAVATLFALLLALPLPRELFREQGAVIGPASWLVCSLVTARVLRLGAARAVVAAVVSGLAAVAAGVAVGHLAGIVVGVLVFALACASSTSARAIGATGIEPVISGLKGRRPNR